MHFFIVHSWRTLIVSLSFIAREKINFNQVSFISLRSFFTIIFNLGYKVLDLDPYFSIPYSYLNSPNNFSDLRKLISIVQAYCKSSSILYIPHARDPMFQLILFAARPSSINFIEEGCLFPRLQNVKHSIQDDIICRVDYMNSFFALPVNVSGIPMPWHLNCEPKYICTMDNKDVTGIPLLCISDSEICRTLSQLSVDLSWDSSCSSDFLIQIGTKDECRPVILHESLNISSQLSKKLNKKLCYCPHPSMSSMGLNNFASIISTYNSHVYSNPCIEYDLFFYTSLSLVGDASSLAITSYRKGHNYWSIQKSISHFLPPRQHQMDISVQLMLKQAMINY